LKSCKTKELYSLSLPKKCQFFFSCPPLEVPSEFDGSQQDFHSDFVPLYANNAHTF
jgi:hypothetical protein